eukprot:273076_1
MKYTCLFALSIVFVTSSIDIDPSRFENAINKDEIMLIIKMVETIQNEIFPLTCRQVLEGDLWFGAAIFLDSPNDNYPLITIGTNREATQSPLYHGEISAITNYWALWKDGIQKFDNGDFNREFYGDQPHIKQTIFFSTHEPCPMCISAISWNNFPKIYYFFSYEDTKDDFGQPKDIEMFNVVFDNAGTETDPYYIEENKWWNSIYILDVIQQIDDQQTRDILLNEYYKTKEVYKTLGWLSDEKPTQCPETQSTGDAYDNHDDDDDDDSSGDSSEVFVLIRCLI